MITNMLNLLYNQYHIVESESDTMYKCINEYIINMCNHIVESGSDTNALMSYFSVITS